MRIFFTRHGESQANVEQVISNRNLPHALTAKGRAQSTALAAQLGKQNIAAIYASPILRAQQTAQIIGERLSAPVTTTPALAEFDCGIMEGRGDAEAWAAHHAVVSDWAAGRPDAHIPEGESFTHMQARFVPFVEQLVAQHEHTEHNFLLVAHGSLLYHMLPLVLANVSSAFIGQQSMRNCLLIDTTVQNGQLICAKWDQTVLLV